MLESGEGVVAKEVVVEEDSRQTSSGEMEHGQARKGEEQVVKEVHVAVEQHGLVADLCAGPGQSNLERT